MSQAVVYVDHIQGLTRGLIKFIVIIGIITISEIATIGLCNPTQAVNTNIDYSINLGSTLNLSVSSELIGLILNPAAINYGSEDLTVSVTTNSINGYNLYINSASTSLNNAELGQQIDTLPSDGTAYTESNFPADYWGYRISNGSTGDPSITSNTNFYPFESGTLVSSSVEPIYENSSTLTFAAKADYNKPAGSYANTYTFSAVSVPISTTGLTIKFAGSGVSGVKICAVAGDCTGSDLIGTITANGGNLSNVENNQTYYLYPSFYAGYSIDSWAVSSVYGTLSSTTATNPTFTMGDGPGVVTLTGKKLGTMQDFEVATCNNMSTGDTATLIDSRDGQAYSIVKVGDGHCWMKEDLLFAYNDNNSGTQTVHLTPEDTNVTKDTDLTMYGAGNQVCYYNTSSSTGGYKDACLYSGTYQLSATNTMETSAWYNYAAATAGTIASEPKGGTVAPPDATEDICPAGWRMPSRAEQIGLVGYVEQLSLGLSGSIYNGKLYSTNTYGEWWTSSQYNRYGADATRRYAMHYAYSGSFDPYNNSMLRYQGLPIRCIKNY